MRGNIENSDTLIEHLTRKMNNKIQQTSKYFKTNSTKVRTSLHQTDYNDLAINISIKTEDSLFCFSKIGVMEIFNNNTHWFTEEWEDIYIKETIESIMELTTGRRFAYFFKYK